MVKMRRWLARTMRKVELVIERGERHWTVKLVRNYLDDDPDGLASMLAFAAIFSLMPVLTVTFLILTLLLQVSAIRNEILELIADDVPPTIAEISEQVFAAGSGNWTALGVLTVLSFMLGGTRLYTAMDRTCAFVFRAPRRSPVTRRLFTVVAMPLIPLLLFAATVVAVTGTSAVTLPLERLFDIHPSTLQTALLYLSALLLGFGMLFLAYWQIPVDRPGARHAAEAAVVTTPLVVLLAQFFPLYIRLFGGYDLYGSLFGFMLLVLFWLYLIGHIFVIGAEIAAYRSGKRRREAPPPRRYPGFALRFQRFFSEPE